MEPADTPTNQRRTMEWQRHAFAVVKSVPELNFASRFYSKMLKRLRIYPATLDANGKVTEITSGRAVELLDRIQDPGGGRSALLGSYGRLMFIAGEGYLLGRNLGADNERWTFTSPLEVSMEDRPGSVASKEHERCLPLLDT
jgi:hypothetical protein